MFGKSFYIFFLCGYLDLFSSHPLNFLLFPNRFKKHHVVATDIILEHGVPLFIPSPSEVRSKNKHDMTGSTSLTNIR